MPTGKLGLEYGRRFWEEDDGIFGGITATNLDIANIWYPASGDMGNAFDSQALTNGGAA